VPSAFAPTDEAVRELLLRHRAADLVTSSPDGLTATMLPFLYDEERNTLRGHLARNNDHWRSADGAAALVLTRASFAEKLGLRFRIAEMLRAFVINKFSHGMPTFSSRAYR